MDDDSRIAEVAVAIAEGSDVDWDRAVEESLDEGQRNVIRELRLIANIAEVAQHDSPSTPSTPATPPMPPALSADLPQTWGHLRLIEKIGKGSFGIIYRSWDANLECEVALKVIPAPPAASRAGRSGVARALSEARLLARVRHRNVVTVHGADSHNGVFGLWMDLIKGRTLEDVLKFHGPLGPQETAHIGVDLCHALAAVHRAGLLHRDVKATNVMREDGGRVVLMDFGAGRHIAPNDESAVLLAGTPLYLAPELYKGAPPSVRSDVYSLGVLLFHLLTGRYPIDGKTAADVQHAHVQGTRELLRDARPDLPPAFISVVECALSPNPAHRFQSAGAFGEAIASANGEQYEDESTATGSVQRWLTALTLTAVVVATTVVGWNFLRDSGSGFRPVTSVPPQTTANATPVNTDDIYQVGAEFFAARDGANVRLAANSRIAPGDRLFMTLELSKPAYAYVINQDDNGEAYVLFPLPGQKLTNPLPAGGATRIPGALANEHLYWQVTSVGGREHFLVFVAPERLTAFERVLAALPRAEVGRPVLAAPLPKSVLGDIRGVGGLTTTGNFASPSDSQLGNLLPLAMQGEWAKGLWARQITFQNPAN